MGVFKKKMVLYFIEIAFLLLTTRMMLFLRDGTSDFIELILIWLILFVSVIIIICLLSPLKDSFENIFHNYRDKLILVIVIILLEFGFLIKHNLSLDPVFLFSIIFSVSILVVISILIPRKASVVFDISVIVIYSLYILAQDIYYHIFEDLFSFKEIGTLGEGVESSTNAYNFNLLHLYIVIIAVVGIVLYIRNKTITHFKINKVVIKKILSILGLLTILLNLNAEYPANFARLNNSDHYVYYSVYSKNLFASKFGLGNFLVRDIVDSSAPTLGYKSNVEYIEKHYDDYPKNHEDNNKTGIYEDMNLIYILAESFDSIAVSEELTPNIYRIKSEGMDFQNHYTPVFPRTTCDTEIILNTGLIPSIQDGPTCYIYNDNSYNQSLATIFNNQEYDTAAFHSNYKEFYTRHIVYDGLGYDEFYGQNELGLSELDKRYDSLFAEYSEDYAIKEDSKFFSFMLSLSGHAPYTNDNHSVEEHYDEVDAYYGTSVPVYIKKYISAQIEADEMLGVLLDDLEKKNELDNTVIIFTNDHYPYMLDNETYMDYKELENDYERNQGVLYIWSNNIEHEVITKVTSSFDILPTINNLFSLEGDYDNYVGNDVFSNNYEPIVYFKDYTVYDGEDYFSLTNGKDNTDFEDDTDYEHYCDIVKIAKHYYEMCKRILRTDYYKVD